MEKEVYLMIDNFLITLEEDNGKGIIIPFDRYSIMGDEVLKLMIKYELANFRDKEISAIQFVYKNLKGIKVLQANGFEKWIEIIEADEKEKKELEREKLKYDVKNARRIFKTYWWTFAIAIGGFIIAVIALGLQLKK